MPFSANHFLYSYIETVRATMTPFHNIAKKQKHWMKDFPFADSKIGRSFLASYELFERLTRQYDKPEFNIKDTTIKNKKVTIKEKTILEKAFCHLIHFKKNSTIRQQKLLIVAPMAGHYATLLRDTVKGMLPHYDVYITDWQNARNIPPSDGPFGFDDYLEYCMEFIKKLGPKLNVMAVCQPSVPVLAATAIMAEQKSKYTPKTLTLMGGPIDTRINPTSVNDYAAERTLRWFEHSVITRVPFHYKGAMRRVYPGFIQLTGFMAMNMHLHVDRHVKLFYHLIEGDGESVEAHKKFYNEYLAVMDLPDEFFLETTRIVFKDHLLPKGKLKYDGKKVNLNAIKDTALLCIEGARDDISGVGQTKAALNLCKKIPKSKKQYHLQENAGHYGIFNGRRYQEHIVPVITDFIRNKG